MYSPPLKTALSRLTAGEIVLLVDDIDKRPTAFLIGSAAKLDTDQVNRMLRLSRGVMLAASSAERIAELGLPLMTNESPSDGIQFTVSVEARHDVSTGISAHDRARTLRALASEGRNDLVMPGHIFPVRAATGGVLARSGAPEATVDLMNMAALPSVGALCHVLDDLGNLLDMSRIEEFAAEHGLSVVAISDIVRERMMREPLVQQVSQAHLPTAHAGEFLAIAFRSTLDSAEHLALCKGDLTLTDSSGLQIPVITRVHAEHQIGDLLGTKDVPHRHVIDRALLEIHRNGRGVFVYIRHRSTELLAEQMRALAGSQREFGKASQLRQLGIGAQILRHLGVRRIALLRSSNRDVPDLSPFGLELVERVVLPLKNSGTHNEAA